MRLVAATVRSRGKRILGSKPGTLLIERNDLTGARSGDLLSHPSQVERAHEMPGPAMWPREAPFPRPAHRALRGSDS